MSREEYINRITKLTLAKIKEKVSVKKRDIADA